MKLRNRFLIASLWASTLCVGGVLVILSGFYLYLSPKLPPVDSIRDIRLETPLRIYTADKKLIGEFGERRRYPIKYEDIPKDFINALISAEDDDFYAHNGVSIKGLLRAVTHLIATGRKGSGGSTLTMQLTRHVFLSLNRTFSRKFNEILLALRIEKELTKEEILELYVNMMFLGKRAYGIEAAAEVYYGKTVGDLNLAQHAMLVGVFKGPSTQNPIANPTRALKRRNYVLSRMLKLEYIDQERYDDALSQPVTAKYHGNTPELSAPYVSEMARKKAIELFGVSAYSQGYEVYTTITSDLQKRANSAIVAGLLKYDQRHGYRGPEQQLDLESAPVFSTEGTTIELSEELVIRDYRKWEESLSNIPDYGGLTVGAVTQINEESISVLKKGGQTVSIAWENGLAQARNYITENSRGPSPKTPDDVLDIGDVIRITQDSESTWHMTQIPAAQASLVSLSPKNGSILALVGGFDFYYSNFNRAIQAQRQPGSNFKPFIYTAALENGLTAATIMNDAPIVIADKQLESTWRPENSSKKFYGPTRLRAALYRSINLVSIRVLDRVGVGKTINSLEKFGFDPHELPHDLSLALGTHAVTPLDVASGYAIFANGGYRIAPYLVQRIENFEHDNVYVANPLTVCDACDEEQTLDAMQNLSPIEETETTTAEEILTTNTAIEEYDFEGDLFELSLRTKQILEIMAPEDYPRAPRVVSEQVAFIIDSMLKDVIKRGTGYKAWKKFKRPDIGGKTGTTNGPLDAWFSGYHPNIVTSTWVGFDQNLPLGRREYGGSAALPIWIDFMDLALADQPIIMRKQPEGIISIKIDPDTGKRAKASDPDAIFEIFRTEHAPEFEETPEVTPWGSEQTITDELGF
ncbi:MAG: penicillin-binding protein 1A [Agarilytica sp.]